MRRRSRAASIGGHIGSSGQVASILGPRPARCIAGVTTSYDAWFSVQYGEEKQRENDDQVLPKNSPCAGLQASAPVPNRNEFWLGAHGRFRQKHDAS
jgi:hypothetical protein